MDEEQERQMPDEPQVGLLDRAVHLVAAYVTHNALDADRLVPFLTEVYEGLKGLEGDQAPEPVPAPQSAGPKPAVPIESSYNDQNIWCLECGSKQKMLRRHLRNHGMSPEDYRQKWGLPADYPMVAMNYSKERSAAALKSGLGRSKAPRKPRTKPTEE